LGFGVCSSRLSFFFHFFRLHEPKDGGFVFLIVSRLGFLVALFGRLFGFGFSSKIFFFPDRRPTNFSPFPSPNERPPCMYQQVFFFFFAQPGFLSRCSAPFFFPLLPPIRMKPLHASQSKRLRSRFGNSFPHRCTRETFFSASVFNQIVM